MVEPEIYVGPLVVFVPPALLGQGGNFFGEVGVVVFIDHGDVTVFNFQLGHGGVVAVAHFAHLLRGDPQELGHGVADEGAVGEGGDGLVGVLGGVIWGLGNALNLIAAGKAGAAISYGLGQGATLVAALWGVFVWKEFRGGGRRVDWLLGWMFALFVAGIGLIIAAGN